MYSKDKEIIIKGAVLAIAILYFLLPPHNKIAQWGLAINNLTWLITQNSPREKAKEWVFHRNNAIYLARMGNKNGALSEMDKAIITLPNSAPDSDLYGLYSDRAQMKLFYKDYSGALTDYLRLQNPREPELLKIAMLFKKAGKRKRAITYCNKILDKDIKSYAGYACVADVYADAGKYEASVAIMDLLIDRVPNRAKYYYDRAYYKDKAGDIKGSSEDFAKAESIAGYGSLEKFITEEAINPKVLSLTLS